MTLKYNLPKFYSMLSGVTKEDQPKKPGEFWEAVAIELGTMIEYASYAQEPQIVMAECRKAGTQYIWEFWVNDLAKPVVSDVNWHGQNTSQWKYAGAIVLQGGEVSTHH